MNMKSTFTLDDIQNARNALESIQKTKAMSRREVVSALYDTIRQKQKEGISLTEIIDHLKQTGIVMTKTTLCTYLKDERSIRGRIATA